MFICINNQRNTRQKQYKDKDKNVTYQTGKGGKQGRAKHSGWDLPGTSWAAGRSQGVQFLLWSGTGQVIRALEGQALHTTLPLVRSYPWNNCPWCWESENSEKSHIKYFMKSGDSRQVFNRMLHLWCGLNVTPGNPPPKGGAHEEFGSQCQSVRGWWGIHPYERINVVFWEWVHSLMDIRSQKKQTNIKSKSALHFLTYPTRSFHCVFRNQRL